jgi:dihydrofolate reductase
MSGDAQRRLILHMAVSLDGFVARSDGVIDWLSTRRPGGVDHGDHRHHANLEMLGQIGLVVLGRRALRRWRRPGRARTARWPGS